MKDMFEIFEIEALKLVQEMKGALRAVAEDASLTPAEAARAAGVIGPDAARAVENYRAYALAEAARVADNLRHLCAAGINAARGNKNLG